MNKNAIRKQAFVWAAEALLLKITAQNVDYQGISLGHNLLIHFQEIKLKFSLFQQVTEI